MNTYYWLVGHWSRKMSLTVNCFFYYSIYNTIFWMRERTVTGCLNDTIKPNRINWIKFLCNYLWKWQTANNIVIYTWLSLFSLFTSHNRKKLFNHQWHTLQRQDIVLIHIIWYFTTKYNKIFEFKIKFNIIQWNFTSSISSIYINNNW